MNTNEVSQPWNLDPSKKSKPLQNQPYYAFIELTFFDKKNHRIYRIHIDEYETENKFKKDKTISLFYIDNSVTPSIHKIFSEPLRNTTKNTIENKIENYPFFSIENDNLFFSKNIFKASFTQSKVGFDLNFQFQNNSELQSLPFIINHLGPNKTKTSSPPALLKLSGKVFVEDESFELDNCTGILSISKGVQRESKYTHALGYDFYSENGTPIDLIFFAQHFNSPTYMKSIEIPFATFLVFYNNKKYSFNSFSHFFNLKQNISDQKWSFSLDSKKLCLKGEVNSEVKEMFLQRLENTDSSLLFKSFSLNANMEINIFENGRLTLRGISKNYNILGAHSIQQNPYIHHVLE